MAEAAYTGVYSTSVDGSTWYDLDDTTTVGFSLDGDELDTSKFGSSGWKESIVGLMGASVDIAGNYKPGDTAQGQLQTAMLGRSIVYIKALFNGTNGFTGQFRCFGFKNDSAVADLSKFSYTLKSVSAITAVP
jgi:predicted secreted protein